MKQRKAGITTVATYRSTICPVPHKSNKYQQTLRVCLVHFAKLCKDVNRAFEVLNEVYLQNFLHRWVVNRETNLMMQNRLHLVLQISKIPFYFNAFTAFLRLHAKN